MSIFHTIAQWLSLGKTATVAPSKTATQVLAEHASSLPEDRRQHFFEESLAKLEQLVVAKLGQLTLASPGPDKDGLARQTAEEIAALHYAATEAKNNDMLKIALEKLVELSRTWSEEGSVLARALESYMQENEESLLDREVAGDYTLKASETGRWVFWPLAQGSRGHAAQSHATSQLSRIFHDLPELACFDFEHTVPQTFVSTTQVLQSMAGRKVSALRLPGSTTYVTYNY